MGYQTLEQCVAWLFALPAPAVRGGVGAESELSHTTESDLAISAWVETPRAGVRLDLGSDGLLRLVAYDPESGQEAVMFERPIEPLVDETLRRRFG
jgi:hypothetical protein